jgi:DNA repair exonuclease SbcCD ATPase subunit
MSYKKLPIKIYNLSEFNTLLNSLDKRTENVNSIMSEDSNKLKEYKNLMLENRNEIQQKLNESKEEITKKLKEQFKSDIEAGEKLYNENVEISNQLENEIKELNDKISNLENNSLEKLAAFEKKENELEDLKYQYSVLKQDYNDELKKNQSLKRDIDTQKMNINDLETEMEDLKVVIKKLIESRKILNKFFKTHYDNFTEEEKKLIREIENSFLNNPNLDNLDDLDNLDNLDFPNINMNNYNNINQNKPNVKDNNLLNLRTNINNMNTIDSMNRPNNETFILNEKEYSAYQEKLKNRGQYTNNRLRQYIGPDDDYWYEQDKNNQ